MLASLDLGATYNEIDATSYVRCRAFGELAILAAAKHFVARMLSFSD